MSKKRKTIFKSFELSSNWYTNKYFIATFALILWLSLFDNDGFATRIKLNRALKKMERLKLHYEKEIAEAKIERQEIDNNREKYARENFLMHRLDEDVIIIEEKK